MTGRAIKRTTISTGIYRDRHGYSVRWRENGETKDARFPPDTPLHKLKDYRKQQTERVEKQPKSDTRHGLARDVVRYLKLKKGRPGHKAERSHLRAWVHRFPRTSRWALTRSECQLAIAEWQREGLSAQTVLHRVRALLRMYHALDGSKVTTPLDDITIPSPPKPRPRSVADDLLRKVAERLKHQEENDGRMKGSQSRARFLVLATTGQRPAQMMRAKAPDVDLERRIWFVDPAKGDRGTIVYLNDDMVEAWRLFFEANAWGNYSTSAFARCLRRAGWPEGIRPYNARHTVGLTLSERGVDLGDITAHMGHSSTDTTRKFYVPAVLARLKAASATLDGRLGGLADLPQRTSTNEPTKEQQNSKTPVKQRKRVVVANGGRRSRKVRKSA
ncbi:MAG TPA: tyrosine-type recombinase/integrase [Vicinamibacterales bacterium]